MSADCVCPGDVPVCPRCGHRWEHLQRYSDGTIVYTSAEVAARYHALYGQATPPFEPVLSAPAVWTIGVDAYQHAKGVERPWICEISPFQYARLSKAGKARYDAKRAAEWDAAGACVQEYRREVLAAYARGEFTVRIHAKGIEASPGLHRDASETVWFRLHDEERATAEEARRAAADANAVAHDDLAVGDRLWHVIFSRYVTVVKKSRLSFRAVDDEGREFGAKAQFCRRLSHADLEASSSAVAS